MKQWFSYDPEGNGFEFHDTAEKAKARADGALGEAEGAAYDGGWEENVTDICWGQVSERVRETERRKGEPDEEFDEYIVYGMRATQT